MCNRIFSYTLIRGHIRIYGLTQTHYSNAAPSTSQTRLPNSEPTNEKHCTLHRALTIEIFTFSKTDWDCGNQQEIKDMGWTIWDELRARGSQAIIQNSSPCRTVPGAHARVHGYRGRGSETRVRARDMICILSGTGLPPFWAENPEI